MHNSISEERNSFDHDALNTVYTCTKSCVYIDSMAISEEQQYPRIGVEIK